MVLLKANDLPAAKDLFVAAAIKASAASSIDDVACATLLANRAASLLRTQDSVSAALDAITCLCLGVAEGQLRLKVHLRLATALLDLSDPVAAALACDAAAADCGSEAPSLMALRRRVASTGMDRDSVSVTAPSTFFPSDVKYQTVEDIIKEGVSTPEMDESFNFFASNLTAEQVSEFTGSPDVAILRNVAKYHEEMALHGQWPAGVDVAKCAQLLSKAYQLDVSNLNEVGMVSPMMESSWPEPRNVVKRLGSVDESVMRYLLVSLIVENSSNPFTFSACMYFP
jgi:hypothetical protein